MVFSLLHFSRFSFSHRFISHLHLVSSHRVIPHLRPVSSHRFISHRHFIFSQPHSRYLHQSEHNPPHPAPTSLLSSIPSLTPLPRITNSSRVNDAIFETNKAFPGVLLSPFARLHATAIFTKSLLPPNIKLAQLEHHIKQNPLTSIPEHFHPICAHMNEKGREMIELAVGIYLFHSYPNLRGEIEELNLLMYTSRESLSEWGVKNSVASVLRFDVEADGYE
jgi:hypothetical protein